MKRLKKWWKPMLLGMVLATILFGVAGARPLAAPLKVVTVSAADCIPSTDHDWLIAGNSLEMLSGSGAFTCPVHFPEYGTKRVRIIKAYVYDTVAGVVNARAYRTAPAGATQDAMTDAMASTNSAAMPAVLTRSWGQISNEVVTQSHGMYMSVSINVASPSLLLFGFKIWYI